MGGFFYSFGCHGVVFGVRLPTLVFFLPPRAPYCLPFLYHFVQHSFLFFFFFFPFSFRFALPISGVFLRGGPPPPGVPTAPRERMCHPYPPTPSLTTPPWSPARGRDALGFHLFFAPAARLEGDSLAQAQSLDFRIVRLCPGTSSVGCGPIPKVPENGSHRRE